MTAPIKPWSPSSADQPVSVRPGEWCSAGTNVVHSEGPIPAPEVVVDGVTLFRGSPRAEKFRELGLDGYRTWAEAEWKARSASARLGSCPPGHMLPKRPLTSNYR